jgi:hypothetical protein
LPKQAHARERISSKHVVPSSSLLFTPIVRVLPFFLNCGKNGILAETDDVAQNTEAV